MNYLQNHLQKIHSLVASLCLTLLFASSALAVPNGYTAYTVPLGGSPAGLAFDDSGSLFAIEGAPFNTNQTQLHIIALDNTISSSVTVTGDDDLFFVGGMAYDPITDSVLITDNGADGRLYSVTRTGVQQTLATGLATIAGVAVRSTGEIFVSTASGGNTGSVLQVDRVSGNATSVIDGLDFGGGITFDSAGDLYVIESDETTFQGRILRLPITDSETGLEFGTATDIASGLQPGYDIAFDNEGDLFATGSGGLFTVEGTPLAASFFDSNEDNFPFATALAFDAGALPFEPNAGADAGRLAYSTGFLDHFVTLIRPTPPVDANFNDDLAVDAIDLGIWQAQHGAITTASNAQGDSDGDFDVDGTDFLNWQRLYDVQISASQVQNVPEPATSVLIILAALGIVGTRSRHQRR